MKKRSHRISLVKYGFIVPLFSLAVMLSSAKIADKTQPKSLQRVMEEINPTNILPTRSWNTPTNQVETKPDTLKPTERTIYHTADQLPEFPEGGIPGLYQWMAANIKYPQVAMQEKVEGKVFVKFVLEADGSVGDVSIIKGIHPSLEAEAIRVVKSMPKWKPGKVKDQNVALYFNMPIVFSLGKSGESPEKTHEKPKTGNELNETPQDKSESELVVIGQSSKSPTSTEQKDPLVVVGVSVKNPGSSNSIPENSEFYVNKRRMESFDFKSLNPSDIKSISIDKKSGVNKIFIELKEQK